MNKQTIPAIITTALGVIGILLILAGPAFKLLPSNPALFAGIACLIIGAAVKGFFRRQKTE
ncbi:hypothetical protein HQ544_04555 [Candidatus Falkowbacteria bacterium]|nr:hypothetical protein [Candidatus Falkowbacteria bacterium]